MKRENHFDVGVESEIPIQIQFDKGSLQDKCVRKIMNHFY